MNTKKCSKCGIEKPLEEFSKSKCKLCVQKYNKQYSIDNKDKILKDKKQYYEDNKEKINQKQKDKRIRNKEYTDKVKAKQGCACGEKDPCCLDFHHINPKTKHKEVSTLVKGAYSIKMIQEEIDKCEVLCANCHREKHFKNIYVNKKVEFVRNLKKIGKCEICGHKGIASLTFHHRIPEDKTKNIKSMCSIKGYSLKDIENEIKKCDLLCENDHRKLHYELRKENARL